MKPVREKTFVVSGAPPKATGCRICGEEIRCREVCASCYTALRRKKEAGYSEEYLVFLGAMAPRETLQDKLDYLEERAIAMYGRDVVQRMKEAKATV